MKSDKKGVICNETNHCDKCEVWTMRISRAICLLATVLALVGLRSAWGGDLPTPAAGFQHGAPYFRDHIMPMLDRLGCNAAACHGAPKNKTGLQLSLFGADPAADYAAMVADKAAEGKKGDKVPWRRKLPLASGTIDLLQAAKAAGEKQTDNRVIYARVLLQADADCKVHLSMGSDDGLRVLLKGKQVFRNDNFSSPNQRQVDIDLVKGKNSLLFGVVNYAGDWSLQVEAKVVGGVKVTQVDDAAGGNAGGTSALISWVDLSPAYPWTGWPKDEVDDKAYPPEIEDQVKAEAKASAKPLMVNKAEPPKSLLLLKASGGADHKGGKLIPPDSAEYSRVIAWISQGAPWADEKAPKLKGIKLLPVKQSLDKGKSGAVQVMATYDDGSEKDVTAEARYRTLDVGVGEVASRGKITAKGFGETAIVATYLRRSAVARVAVPQKFPNGFPDVGANNKIDELVNAKLKELGIPPSDLCTDAEFLRRASFDAIGVLPKPEEARAFLADKDPQKRSKLVHRLLERNEYADYWTLKWGDLLRLKSETPIEMWPNGVQAFRQWLHQAMVENRPLDRFATELITAAGSSFREPAANFYRGVPELSQPTVATGGNRGVARDAAHQADATAVLFMGVRTECMRCHAHPTESWTQEDHLGLSAIFAQIAYKTTKEYKEEIVYLDYEKVLTHPETKAPVIPKLPGGPALAAGAEEDLRVKFAAWLTAADNPWFARCAANRVWYWLMGRGIVHEPDDLRPTNPPSNPELLAFLADELVKHKYDMKHLFRLILTSRTYQRSSRANEWNARDRTQFSHYQVRRLPAEPLADAIAQVTGSPDQYASIIPQPHKAFPVGFGAMQIDDGAMTSGFLGLFGRPPRDSPYECARSNCTSMPQELYLFNDESLMNKISGGQRLSRWQADKKNDAEVVEDLYLSALCRFPTEAEKQAASAYLGKDPQRQAEARQDLIWSVLNTREFLFNH
jgi:hypothetical protein